MSPLKVSTELERWPLRKPFRISGYEFTAIEVLVVSLEQGGHTGRGEAAGVYYRNDKPDSMLRQIHSIREVIEAGIDRDSLRSLLPPGGARNALDCALWDLEAKLSGCFAWQLASLQQPAPLLTTFTCGADQPQEMASTARGYVGARAIKIKLTGDALDVDRVQAVREAKPDAWLGVDANQAFNRTLLEQLMPVFVSARVALIEQPFPIGQEALLDGFRSPIPIAADESVQSSSDVRGLSGRFDVVNIKLDKCGGLTEALTMARAARDAGLELMVGNMIGTSLAMAPAFLVGQLCQVADLDGPIFLTADRRYPVQYADGLLTCPDQLWGGRNDVPGV